MASPKKASALAGIFDEPENLTELPVAESSKALPAVTEYPRRDGDMPTQRKRDSHPGKKPVLIHIPEEMHRTLRQLSVEEGGEPLTVITERLLRQYLVQQGHTRFAP